MGGGSAGSGRLGVSRASAVTAARDKPGVLRSRAKGSRDGRDRGGCGRLRLCPQSRSPHCRPHPHGGRVAPHPRACTGGCSSSHRSSRFSLPLCPDPGLGANARQAVQPLGKEEMLPQEDPQPTLHLSPSAGHGSPITQQRALPQGPNSSPVRQGAKLGAAQPWHIPPRRRVLPQTRVVSQGWVPAPAGSRGERTRGRAFRSQVCSHRLRRGHLRCRGRLERGAGGYGARCGVPWSCVPRVAAWLLLPLHKHTRRPAMPRTSRLACSHVTSVTVI